MSGPWASRIFSEVKRIFGLIRPFGGSEYSFGSSSKTRAPVSDEAHKRLIGVEEPTSFGLLLRVCVLGLYNVRQDYPVAEELNIPPIALDPFEVLFLGFFAEVVAVEDSGPSAFFRAGGNGGKIVHFG